MLRSIAGHGFEYDDITNEYLLRLQMTAFTYPKGDFCFHFKLYLPF